MVVLADVSVDVLIPEAGEALIVAAGEALIMDEFVVVVLLLWLVSVCVPPAGDGFTIVVFVSFLVPGEAPGATVSVFCSQAARSAALARMQMYFFMVFYRVPRRDTA